MHNTADITNRQGEVAMYIGPVSKAQEDTIFLLIK